MPTEETNTLKVNNHDHQADLSTTRRCPNCTKTLEPLRNATMGLLWCPLCQKIFTKHEVDGGPQWERLK
jgi:hypothetical protein